MSHALPVSGSSSANKHNEDVGTRGRRAGAVLEDRLQPVQSHHECNHSSWWMCFELQKKYSSFRALEDGEKCSFPVLVSCGEQKH